MNPSSHSIVGRDIRFARWPRLALAGAIFLLASAPVVAKSYRVQSLIVDARVESDGTLRVEEAITYRFDGRFKFAYRDIPISGEASISDVGVREAGTVFAESTSESPGTFNVSPADGETRVTWHYRARNETRTFRLTYTLSGAVKRYPDIGELYFKFVGDGWDRPIGRVHTTVHLPGTVPAAAIRAWAHGPLHGLVLPPQDSTVVMNVSPLPARTFFEGRVLFPATVLTGVSVAGATRQLDILLAEERNWAAQANARRERARQLATERARQRQRQEVLARQLLPYALLAGLVAAVIWVMLWRVHGRPHAVESTAAAGEIPSEHPPAVISTLTRRGGSGTMLAATLLDLVRRGHFVIEEEEQQQVSGWSGRESTQTTYTFRSTGKDTRDLLPFEVDLRSFVLSEAGDGKSFEMADLKNLARHRRSHFRRWLMAWNKAVRDHVRDLGLQEPVSGRAIASNLLTGFLVAGAGGIMLFLTRSPMALFALVPGVLQIFLTAALQRLTPVGRQLQIAWRRFAHHLKQISRGLGPPSLSAPSWERYLVLAVVFGLHEKVLPALRLPAREAGMVYPVWYSAAHGGSAADGIAGLSQGIAAMASAVSSTASSAVGAGGGASVGGGGGAGGGGGGAG